MAIGDGGARRRIAAAEVDLEKFYEGEERLPLGMADVIVERERVAVVAEFGAELDDFLRGRDVFEDFDDDLIGREQARGAALQGEEIEIDERFGVSGERLQAEEHGGIDDHTVAGVLVGLEDVFAGGTKEEFVGEEFEFVVEDRLTGDEFFEHAASLSRKAERQFLRGS